jgi:5,10-methylenetetrahydrofolate reductase
MTSLGQSLEQKDFLVTVELEPPKGPDLAPLVELASAVGGRADAVVVADNPRAQARLGPVLAAHKLAKHAGCPVVVTLTCRDRNRLALTSEMLAAAAAGAQGLLMVSGDFVTLGDHPQAKPVYDLDSVQGLFLARELAQGRDLAGGGLEAPVELLLGAAANPAAEPLGPQLLKLRKKRAAGATLFWGAPAPAQAVAALLAQAEGLRLVAGVEAGGGAAGLVSELRGSGAAGVHLSAPGAPGELAGLLDACGR